MTELKTAAQLRAEAKAALPGIAREVVAAIRAGTKLPHTGKAHVMSHGYGPIVAKRAIAAACKELDAADPDRLADRLVEAQQTIAALRDDLELLYDDSIRKSAELEEGQQTILALRAARDKADNLRVDREAQQTIAALRADLQGTVDTLWTTKTALTLTMNTVENCTRDTLAARAALRDLTGPLLAAFGLADEAVDRSEGKEPSLFALSVLLQNASDARTRLSDVLGG